MFDTLFNHHSRQDSEIKLNNIRQFPNTIRTFLQSHKMPIDRIRRMPIEKILSNRSKKSKNGEDNDSDNSIDSDLALLPPPRRSAVSRLGPRRMSRSRSWILRCLISLSAILLVLHLLPRHKLAKTEKPAILLWNDDENANDQRQLNECDCMVTNKRNYTNGIIDAIIFNVDRPYSIEGLEKIYRTPHFLAVLAAKEPLSLAEYPVSEEGESIFNFTMTYRLDSDIIWSDYYFTTKTNLDERIKFIKEPQDNHIKKLFKTTDPHLRYNLNLKSKLAVYLMYEVDNSTYDQSIYLQELRKHMNLSVIQSFHETQECISYKFMLIFEPSCCPDYVHPQMYMAYAHFVVPVLIGGGNLSELVPPNSFIRGDQFSSPKSLAKHLKFLSQRPGMYEDYFWWHSKYQIHHLNQPFCALCHQLSQSRARRSNNYFLDWWTQYTCPDPSDFDFKYHKQL